MRKVEVSEEGSDLFASTATANRRDLVTNVTAKSTQTNGGPSPESVPNQEPTSLATVPTTTTTTTTTVSTTPAAVAVSTATDRKPLREEQTSITQTEPHAEAPHSSAKQPIVIEPEKRQNPEQERGSKEKERQGDPEREKALERKRERERLYNSRGPSWSGSQPGSSSAGHSQRPPSHHPPYGPVPGPVSSYRLSPCLPPLQNPHSMFSATSVRPQTPLTSTALPMPTPATQSTNPFGPENGPNFSYPGVKDSSIRPPSGNQQQELIQELNNRFIHNQQSMTYPPMPFMRETHMHQHMHQHQHTHAFVPPAPIMGSTLLPTATPQLTREREQHKAFQLGMGIPPPSVPVIPPSSIGNSLGSSGHGAFQPKKAGKWCKAHVTVAWLIHHDQQQKAKVESHKEQLGKPGPHLFSPHRHLDPHMQSFFQHGPPGLPHAQLPGAPHHASLLTPPSSGQLGIPPPKHNGYSSIGSLGFPPGSSASKGLGGIFSDRESLTVPSMGSSHSHWARLYHRPPQGFPHMGPTWVKPEPERPKEAFLDRDRLKEEERLREKEKLEHERQRERERRDASNSDHSTRKDDTDHRSSLQNHDRGSSSRATDGDRDGHSSQNGKLLDGRISGGLRTSPPRFPHDIRTLDMHRDPRADSAFNNVLHSNPLYHKDDRREHEKERVEAMHNSVGLHPVSILERNRLEASSSFNPPLHGLDALHRAPNPSQWDVLGRVHPLDQLRPPDLLELERDRLFRSTLPQVPVLDGDRFREREPHDFTRDNPLAFRRMEAQQHQVAHFLEERDRLIEAERNRLLHVADHPQIGLLPKPMIGASQFHLPRTSLYPFLAHKNGTPPTTQPPPPLISSIMGNGIGAFPLGSRPHSRNTSPKNRELLLKQEPMSGEHSQSSREKATPDKEAQSR
ncbi:Autism susceptibility protein2 protein [Holothuria leucospilota]|uniref:Autism susceptibility protein2 protein n=1 Tax=Holothuria leucospilota TaxID=206669 RepID=A0A9Q1CFA0_HOLLE|nr:Autism susceptibility protein2 protein [Holothuria leucospilota]